MILAMVPAAPDRKNQRTTSCPAPISAKVPYQLASWLICSAFWWVSTDCSRFRTSVTACSLREVGSAPAVDASRAVSPHEK